MFDRSDSYLHDFATVFVCIISRCNRYNGGPAEESLAARRASVERYKFYRNRYENHKESLKPERSLYPWVESKMENLRKVTSIDVQFLRKVPHS